MTSGFTYPEVLLMRAEGYARTGKLAEAIADLNLLRRYRFKPEAPQLTVGTQDEVIAEVLKERRRELPASGIKRFLDLKRFVLDAGKSWQKTKVVHKLGAETYEAVIDSDAFILNIANTILQYNPHWNVPLDNRTF
ncbi:RagB/SusD family nutrient uptake outer membrane protein [Chitinophaga pollutisoli]|uniref:RagB/SusD family nutrient uptake outer membrane protein n=1 Tax=Chitinophaga pollutisoli TaxID=3133966 RepID=A0ABZ2YLC7_9BACT